MFSLLRSILAAAASCFMLAPPTGWAAGIDPATIEKAKKEGELTFYTTLTLSQIGRPLFGAFEKKYGIKVIATRADSQATLLKLINEARAGRVQADVWNLTTGLKSLIDAGGAAKFDVPSAAANPQAYKDPNGYWVATNIYVNTLGYNTRLVPAKDAPKTYEDLLAPKWKGKMAWKPNDPSGAVGFIGNILTSWGEEKGMAYLRALARQDVATVEASARAVFDRVIAGDYPIALQMFNHHAVISANRGAPSAWIALEPVTVTLQLAGITKGARHPNAALLFIDFMLSEEGQKIFQAAEYLPAHPNVPAFTASLKPEAGGFRATVLSPDTIDRNSERWTQVYMQLFR